MKTGKTQQVQDAPRPLQSIWKRTEHFLMLSFPVAALNLSAVSVICSSMTVPSALLYAQDMPNVQTVAPPISDFWSFVLDPPKRFEVRYLRSGNQYTIREGHMKPRTHTGFVDYWGAAEDGSWAVQILTNSTRGNGPEGNGFAAGRTLLGDYWQRTGDQTKMSIVPHEIAMRLVRPIGPMSLALRERAKMAEVLAFGFEDARPGSLQRLGFANLRYTRTNGVPVVVRVTGTNSYGDPAELHFCENHELTPCKIVQYRFGFRPESAVPSETRIMRGFSPAFRTQASPALCSATVITNLVMALRVEPLQCSRGGCSPGLFGRHTNARLAYFGVWSNSLSLHAYYANNSHREIELGGTEHATTVIEARNLLSAGYSALILLGMVLGTRLGVCRAGEKKKKPKRK